MSPLEALALIVKARDAIANGEDPPFEDYQAFDDWAADLAEAALKGVANPTAIIEDGKLKCPSCGSTRMKAGEYVWHQWQDGECEPVDHPDVDVQITLSCQETVWDGCKEWTLMCGDCTAELETPERVEIEYE